MTRLDDESTLKLLQRALQRGSQLKEAALPDDDSLVDTGVVKGAVFDRSHGGIEGIGDELGIDYDAVIEASRYLMFHAMRPSIMLMMSGRIDAHDLMSSVWLDGFTAGLIMSRMIEAEQMEGTDDRQEDR